MMTNTYMPNVYWVYLILILAYCQKNYEYKVKYFICDRWNLMAASRRCHYLQHYTVCHAEKEE